MDRDDALEQLLRLLKSLGYRFVAVTPATHARVVAPEPRGAPTLRDVFGWSRRFRDYQFPPALLALMHQAAILRPDGEAFRSTVRVASLGDDLFLHSAYPTDQADAVFFGPDTYRFARFIAAAMSGLSPRSIVDMGAGSGAGGLFAARLAPAARVTLVDMNPAALALARINARAAGVAAETLHAQAIPRGADLILANPPYIIDEVGRAYRDGGGLLGGEVALDWVRDALAKLAPGGTMLLYTGAAVVEGAAPLTEELERACAEAGASLTVEELDPDVFGEELEHPAYGGVERIAAIGAVIRAAG